MNRDATIVLARFDDAEPVRKAFTELQNHGVDAADIRVGGERAESMQSATQREAGRERLDHQLEGFVTRRVITGAAIGAALGALTGAVVALTAVNVADIDSNARPLLFILLVLAIAVIGATLGAFLLVERSVGYDDTWQLTLDTDGDGRTWIAVRVSDDDAREAVLTRLREMSPPPSEVDVHTGRPDGAHTVQW